MMIASPTAAAAEAPAATRPVVAHVRREPGGVHLTLLGASDRVLAVRYTLSAGAAGNRATQSGAATLLPGHPATLLTLVQSGDGWSGTLIVEPQGLPVYRVELVPG